MKEHNMTEPNSTAADEAAIRALYQQAMDGWNRGSGEAFAAPFAEDGDLVGFDGTHLKGRQEITNSLIRTSKVLVWLERLGVCDF
jgi:uncharacterized protein (TIGR02246 family)